MAAADNLTTAGRVPAFEKQLKQLKDGMKSVINGHKSIAKAHKLLKENVDKAQTREPYTDLEKAFGAVRDALDVIEKRREAAVTERMQSTVLGKVKDMEKRVTGPIKDRLTAKDKAASALARQLNKANADQAAIADARTKSKDADKAFIALLPEFEHTRVEDTKVLLTEFCNSLMFYHCRAVEELSAALAALGDVDGGKAKKAMKSISSRRPEQAAVARKGGGRVRLMLFNLECVS